MPAQTGICCGDGQKCSSEADRPARNPWGSSTLSAKRQTEHIYGEAHYTAGSGPIHAFLVIKAEVVPPPEQRSRDNPRFLITNVKQSPQWIYERCTANVATSKSYKGAPRSGDRSHQLIQFWANQFHVLLTAAAYVLMQ